MGKSQIEREPHRGEKQEDREREYGDERVSSQLKQVASKEEREGKQKEPPKGK